MRSINKVIIIGNLTRDPELHQTPNGQDVTTFGVATNREWMTKSGEKHNSAEFHECVAWSHLAEICSQYLHKGHLVYIEGYLKTRNWEGPDGTKKFKTEIVVKDMIKLEKAPRTQNALEEDASAQREGAGERGQSPSANEWVSRAPRSEPKKESSSSAGPSEAELTNNNEDDPISKDLGL